MCVVSHDCAGLIGAGMEVVVGRHARQSQEVCRMSRDAGALY